MRKTLNPLVVILFVVAAAALNVAAQTESGRPAATDTGLVATNSVGTPMLSESAARTQAIVSSLANLPEADTLIYVNPKRILNEVLPKFLPAKDIEGMRKGFDEMKKSAGVDPTKIDYIVLAVRFKKPTADLNFQPPEFLMVSSGDFSAATLLTLAHGIAGEKLRDEAYGDKTISLMTIEPLAKESEKNPFLKAFTEVGAVALNDNTIATGSPAYLRAAIDAGAGKGRISTENLNSLVRDSSALMSFAGRPWHAFAESFGMLGTEATARTPRCESKMGDVYAALTMDSSNFMIRGVTNADNPDTAKIVANLYSMLMRYATSSIKDPPAQQILNAIVISAEGDEVLLRADFPQQMIMDLIQQQMKPKIIDATKAADVSAPTKPVVKRRRTRRRN